MRTHTHVSSFPKDKEIYSCVVSFHMWSGNQKQSDDPGGDPPGWPRWDPKGRPEELCLRVVFALVWLINIWVLRSRLPASLFVGQGFPPTDTKGLKALRRPCSDASVGLRICVIAKRLGYLHWLAHAAEAGPFLCASTSPRTFSSFRAVCRRHMDEKLAPTAQRTQLSSVNVHQRCSHAPLGDLWKGTTSASLRWSNESR